MDSQKQQVVERLKQANNILVTVSSNPSVDQLAACIGVTLALNKMDKHATAVFSGAVPSTIEFLQPEKTIEKNTNSLQDFIIALDKSKADKLRYKVEDTMVKIFITPYRTSIGQNDLQFSQGDFNVDVVLALGVHAQNDLDQAITSHGRILHDATVISVNVAPGGELGSVNWLDTSASSLSELSVLLINALDQKLLDGQIATSLLTGIVAETDRFSNLKTSPQTMSMSAELMSAGANQQLVATELEVPEETPVPVQPIAETAGKDQSMTALPPTPTAKEPPKPQNDDGTIEIKHEEMSLPPVSAPTGLPPALPPANPTPQAEPEPELPKAPQIHIDDQGRLHPNPNNMGNNLSATDVLPPEQPLPPIVHEQGPRLMTEPPTFETPPLTANAMAEKEESSSDPLTVGLLNREPLLSQQPLTNRMPNPSAPTPPNPMTPAQLPPATNPVTTAPQSPLPSPKQTPPAWTPPIVAPASGPSRTLSQIEQAVGSPHAFQATNQADTNIDNMLPPDPTPPNGIVTPTNLPAADTTGRNVSDARDLVAQAIKDNPGSQPPEPIVALNAAPLGADSLHPENQSTNTAIQPSIYQPPQSQGSPLDLHNAPPSVPPPMMPPASS